jgi:hypothetical protein
MGLRLKASTASAVPLRKRYAANYLYPARDFKSGFEVGLSGSPFCV